MTASGNAKNVYSERERCALCQRAAPLTRHHLIPRALHRKKRFRRRFSRATMSQLILMLCRPCHHHIHRWLSEIELAEHYRSRETLLSHLEIHHFVEWLSGKPAGFKPHTAPRRR